MNPLAIRILLAGAICFGLLAGGAWAYQHHKGQLIEEGRLIGAAQVQKKWDDADKERAAEEKTQAAIDLALERERQTVATKAANEAKEREQGLRALAFAARTDSQRLSDQLTQANARIATASIDAVRLYAATANAVFDDCQRAYQGMAEEAAGHASDSLMYQRAWPTNPKQALAPSVN